ncbi:MAG: DEAD/DEAH box helicase family protein [Paludibacteraceae bacterium]|nr:DEAD/DEAH box helicase family protein [Paludibacteraceae bacterium]
MDPEAKARINIDSKLNESGWILQDRAEFDRTAALGVAVREFRTKEGNEVDYALFVEGFPCGIIEAKEDNKGVNLIIDTLGQNEAYQNEGLKGNYDKDDIRFIYEATGNIILYKDLKDPNPRTKSIYSFHRPESLKRLIDEYKKHLIYKGTTLRKRLQTFPELPNEGFRDCQIKAILGLEDSFGKNRERSLVQMATGAGKTYTAVTSVYRLLKYAGVKRVLFLVDTNNLGEQAESEFKNYKTYDTKEKFTDLYNIERIQKSYIQDSTNITITTIQRLYSMLCGDLENFADGSDDEQQTDEGAVREVHYNPKYTPEYFDFIIIDECHRSIYNKWIQIFNYFDAFLIGLTATPSSRTYAFFNKNVVSEYSHEQAIVDGVNVGSFGTFVIKTDKMQNGGVVHRMEKRLHIRDKRKRTERWEVADEDERYDGNDLDRSVVNFDTIRVVLSTFRDSWKSWQYFADRNELPKTLIFAKDDSHADDIIRIAKEVFDEGDDFIKKITYQSEESESELLHNFRNEYYPRIAVTVTKIATGTDVKCIEILIFMRDIRNENFYEQMLGRARRVLSKEELIQASPSATSAKLGYVVVDAVGITESPKMQPKASGDPKPTIAFKTLLDDIANAEIDEDIFKAASRRIVRLEKTLTSKQKDEFKELTGGISLTALASNLENAHNIDAIESQVKIEHPNYDYFTDSQKEECIKSIITKRCHLAALPINKKAVRDFLMKVGNANDQTIDPALDSLVSASVKPMKETEVMATFKEFISDETRRNEIEALDIIYHQNYKNKPLTERMIHDLFDRMKEFNASLTQQNVFIAYRKFTKSKNAFKQLTDIIQIIKYEWNYIEELTPFEEDVRARFKTWVFSKNKKSNSSNPFTDEQMEWLRLIRDHISANASISLASLKIGQFAQMGGTAKFVKIFGSNCKELLVELNEALVA